MTEGNGGGPEIQVDFQDQSTGDPDSWEWDFGDGSQQTPDNFLQNPSHVYAPENPGDSVIVRLTITKGQQSTYKEKTIYFEAGAAP